jgi:hypothetical protein
VTIRPSPPRLRRRSGAAVVAALAASTPALAAAAGGSGNDGVEAVAAELANPLAAVTTVSAQYRAEFGVGPADATHHTLRLQPSFFVPGQGRSAFLLRTILPLRSVAWPAGERGVGDLTLVPYYVPDVSSATFVGYGAALGVPTASPDGLGSGRWTAGPAVLFAKTGSPLTWGGLAQHVWSFAGDPARGPVNVTTVQPFATWLLGGGWSAGVNVEATRNGSLPAGERWTVPVALAMSRVVPLGASYANIGVAAVSYVERPSFAPAWELRLSVQYVIR